MVTILKKIRSLTALIILLSFLSGASISSCSGNKKGANTETATEEHPSGEHPGSEEHPSGEHPSSDEHPSDSTKQEHPN
jgi:hypothetical protein